MVVPKVVPLTDTNYIPRDLSAVALGLVTWSCDVKRITSITACVVYLYTCARFSHRYTSYVYGLSYHQTFYIEQRGVFPDT